MVNAARITPLSQPTPVAQVNEIEAALIGKILSLGVKARDAFDSVRDIAPSAFTLEPHRLLWHAFKDLSDANKALSFTLVQDRLNRPLAQSTDTALSRVTAEYMQMLVTTYRHHDIADAAAVVRERAATANGIKVAQAILKDMMTQSPAQAHQSALDRLNTFGSQLQALDGHAGENMATGVQTALKDLKARQQAYLNNEKTGALLSTGYRALDTLLDGGLYRAELTVLLADPSVGKTALSLCIALNAMHQGMRVVFIPLEMTAQKMINRALSVLSRVAASSIRTGCIGDDQLDLIAEISNRLNEQQAAHQFHFLTLDAMPNINAVGAKLHQYVSMHGVDLIVMDQLSPEALSPLKPGIPLHEWISHAGSIARSWATKYNVPVLAPAQLSKGRENRANADPTLKDAAGSYGLMRLADNVLALSRGETQVEGQAEKINGEVLKQRDGARGTFVLDYVRSLTSFENEGEGSR